jgi:hypothetical protein
LLKFATFGWSWLKLADDGLEREFSVFNLLVGVVCTTCAPGDQEKSMVSKFWAAAPWSDVTSVEVFGGLNSLGSKSGVGGIALSRSERCLRAG